MEEHLVTALLEQSRGAKRVLKKDAEQAAAQAVNMRFAPAVAITNGQVQNKLTNATLTRVNGFSWNGEAVTAPDQVWEAYIQAHPDASAFHNNPWPIYNKLRQLFTDLPGPGLPTPGNTQPTIAQDSNSVNANNDDSTPANANNDDPTSANTTSDDSTSANTNDDGTEAEPSEAKPPDAHPTTAPQPQIQPQTKGELAVAILQAQYAHLDDWTLVTAFTVMEDHTKAALFQAMNPGSVRDKWLALQLGQEKFRGLK
ncbi:MAG: hypothetical protein M1840_005931 [Geoglossum simile]|nr:MAG: hypothetical protein M1840_005931 [Geoglossum simile]